MAMGVILTMPDEVIVDQLVSDGEIKDKRLFILTEKS